MVTFVDLLYGHIELPDWIVPFVKLPEFVRLRGVRLSNVDSIYFKDFSGPSRWEHGIAVAALAYRCASKRHLTERERVRLVLAALLHDVGTPPFAHTAEAVLANFDHELEGERLLTGASTADFSPDRPVFQSQLPQFHRACERLARQLDIPIDVEDVARCISGDGELGFLINGAVDLDNADNVTRASLYLGLKVCAQVPLGVTDWLAAQPSAVTDLSDVDDMFVQQWIQYRRRLYTAFFDADAHEMGRMAFLQHLMRRGLDAGMERSQFVWATDEELMARLASMDDLHPHDFRPALAELTQRYRLLESPECLAKVDIDDDGTLRVLRHPDAVAWITRELRTERLEPMVLVMSRRFGDGASRSLLPEPVGTLYVFQLGRDSKGRELERRIQALSGRAQRSVGPSASALLRQPLYEWAVRRPWNESNGQRTRNIKSALQSVGDWGFRLSRNDGFHAYPSTFVHALPANLLVALGLRDDIVLDLFGGTGQTALEAIKYGNAAVSGDANTIATLVAKARLTFIPAPVRTRLHALTEDRIRRANPAEPPAMELLEEWFHDETLDELSHIVGYIDELHEPVLQTFLRACLSSILPASTARRGEQHGYFADNCPLPSDLDEPPRQPAMRLFVEKTHQAVSRAERLYSYLQREGRDPAEELARVRICQADVLSATPDSYGLTDGSVGAIITSPPYLCMADYALGQRLSYEWLAPPLLQTDFAREIGPRRQRLKKGHAAEIIGQYINALSSFASLAGRLVRSGGFVAVVLGEPVAAQFRDAAVTAALDRALEAHGFTPLWSTERPIHWHRNHGYARLKKERVSVHVRT